MNRVIITFLCFAMMMPLVMPFSTVDGRIQQRVEIYVEKHQKYCTRYRKDKVRPMLPIGITIQVNEEIARWGEKEVGYFLRGDRAGFLKGGAVQVEKTYSMKGLVEMIVYYEEDEAYKKKLLEGIEDIRFREGGETLVYREVYPQIEKFIGKIIKEMIVERKIRFIEKNLGDLLNKVSPEDYESSVEVLSRNFFQYLSKKVMEEANKMFPIREGDREEKRYEIKVLRQTLVYMRGVFLGYKKKWLSVENKERENLNAEIVALFDAKMEKELWKPEEMKMNWKKEEYTMKVAYDEKGEIKDKKLEKNGEKILERYYEAGVLNGAEKHYRREQLILEVQWEKGKRVKQERFKDGYKNGLEEYFANDEGNKVSKRLLWDQGEKIWRKTYQGEELIEERYFKDDEKNQMDRQIEWGDGKIRAISMSEDLDAFEEDQNRQLKRQEYKGFGINSLRYQNIVGNILNQVFTHAKTFESVWRLELQVGKPEEKILWRGLDDIEYLNEQIKQGEPMRMSRKQLWQIGEMMVFNLLSKGEGRGILNTGDIVIGSKGDLMLMNLSFEEYNYGEKKNIEYHIKNFISRYLEGLGWSKVVDLIPRADQQWITQIQMDKGDTENPFKVISEGMMKGIESIRAYQGGFKFSFDREVYNEEMEGLEEVFEIVKKIDIEAMKRELKTKELKREWKSLIHIPKNALIDIGIVKSTYIKEGRNDKWIYEKNRKWILGNEEEVWVLLREAKEVLQIGAEDEKDVKVEIGGKEEVINFRREILKRKALYESRFRELKELAGQGEIRPDVKINVNKEGEEVKKNRQIIDRGLRIGLFKIDKFPLQHGHILTALRAIIEYKLDKLVWVVGEDEKKDTSVEKAERRGTLLKKVLKPFGGLFEVQDSFEKDIDKFLEQNKGIDMDIYNINIKKEKQASSDEAVSVEIEEGKRIKEVTIESEWESLERIREGLAQSGDKVKLGGKMLNVIPLEELEIIVRQELYAIHEGLRKYLRLRLYRENVQGVKESKEEVLRNLNETQKVLKIKESEEEISIGAKKNKVSFKQEVKDIYDGYRETFAELQELVAAGTIRPEVKINIDREGEVEVKEVKQKIGGRVLKVGFFGVSGNPIDHGDILTALEAMVKYKLDKVVWVVHGVDTRKFNDLIEYEKRYKMLKDALGGFGNLFEVTNISEDTEYSAEMNMCRFLEQNEGIDMEVYYLEGSDHFRYKDNEEQLDTVGKFHKFLKEGIEIPNKNVGWIAGDMIENDQGVKFKVKKERIKYQISDEHSITLLFSGKDPKKLEEGFLQLNDANKMKGFGVKYDDNMKEIRVGGKRLKIETMKLRIETSSTRIRKALRTKWEERETGGKLLHFVPLEVLRRIVEEELYGSRNGMAQYLRERLYEGNIEGIKEAKENTLKSLEETQKILKIGDADNVEQEVKIEGKLMRVNFKKEVKHIEEGYDRAFTELLQLVAEGEIRPEVKMNVDKEGEVDIRRLNKKLGREVRIGFFGVPLTLVHHGHILTALEAMVKYKLDKLVWVVQGIDEAMIEEREYEVRYKMLKQGLEPFGNLFEVIYGRETQREETIYRFLERNKEVDIGVYSIKDLSEESKELKKKADRVNFRETEVVLGKKQGVSTILTLGSEGKWKGVRVVTVEQPSIGISMSRIKSALQKQEEELVKGCKLLIDIPLEILKVIMAKELYGSGNGMAEYLKQSLDVKKIELEKIKKYSSINLVIGTEDLSEEEIQKFKTEGLQVGGEKIHMNIFFGDPKKNILGIKHKSWELQFWHQLSDNVNQYDIKIDTIFLTKEVVKNISCVFFNDTIAEVIEEIISPGGQLIFSIDGSIKIPEEDLKKESFLNQSIYSYDLISSSSNNIWDYKHRPRNAGYAIYQKNLIEESYSEVIDIISLGRDNIEIITLVDQQQLIRKWRKKTHRYPQYVEEYMDYDNLSRKASAIFFLKLISREVHIPKIQYRRKASNEIEILYLESIFHHKVKSKDDIDTAIVTIENHDLLKQQWFQLGELLLIDYLIGNRERFFRGVNFNNILLDQEGRITARDTNVSKIFFLLEMYPNHSIEQMHSLNISLEEICNHVIAQLWQIMNKFSEVDKMLWKNNEYVNNVLISFDDSNEDFLKRQTIDIKDIRKYMTLGMMYGIQSVVQNYDHEYIGYPVRGGNDTTKRTTKDMRDILKFVQDNISKGELNQLLNSEREVIEDLTFKLPTKNRTDVGYERNKKRVLKSINQVSALLKKVDTVFENQDFLLNFGFNFDAIININESLSATQPSFVMTDAVGTKIFFKLNTYNEYIKPNGAFTSSKLMRFVNGEKYTPNQTYLNSKSSQYVRNKIKQSGVISNGAAGSPNLYHFLNPTGDANEHYEIQSFAPGESLNFFKCDWQDQQNMMGIDEHWLPQLEIIGDGIGRIFAWDLIFLNYDRIVKINQGNILILLDYKIRPIDNDIRYDQQSYEEFLDMPNSEILKTSEGRATLVKQFHDYIYNLVVGIENTPDKNVAKVYEHLLLFLKEKFEMLDIHIEATIANVKKFTNELVSDTSKIPRMKSKYRKQAMILKRGLLDAVHKGIVKQFHAMVSAVEKNNGEDYNNIKKLIISDKVGKHLEGLETFEQFTTQMKGFMYTTFNPQSHQLSNCASAFHLYKLCSVDELHFDAKDTYINVLLERHAYICSFFIITGSRITEFEDGLYYGNISEEEGKFILRFRSETGGRIEKNKDIEIQAKDNLEAIDILAQALFSNSEVMEYKGITLQKYNERQIQNSTQFGKTLSHQSNLLRMFDTFIYSPKHMKELLITTLNFLDDLEEDNPWNQKKSLIKKSVTGIDRTNAIGGDALRKNSIKNTNLKPIKEVKTIEKVYKNTLHKLAKLAEEGEIRPDVQINIEEGEDYEETQEIGDRPLKVGFFNLEEGPVHHGHILTALEAIVQYKLDKFVWMIPGVDRNTDNFIEYQMRYKMLKVALQPFENLFNISTLNIGMEHNAEANMCLFLEKNEKIRIDMFVLVDDHNQDNGNKLDERVKQWDDILKDGIHLPDSNKGWVKKDKTSVNGVDFKVYEAIEMKKYYLNEEHRIRLLFDSSNQERLGKITLMQKDVKNKNLEIATMHPSIQISLREIRKALSEGEEIKEEIFLKIPVEVLKIIAEEELYEIDTKILEHLRERLYSKNVKNIKNARYEVLKNLEPAQVVIGSTMWNYENRSLLKTIKQGYDDAFKKLLVLIEEGEIRSDVNININHDKEVKVEIETKKVESRELRIGFFGIQGNPVHHGDILTALEAMAEYKLDKMVWVLQGIDDEIDYKTRYEILKVALSQFGNLFEITHINQGTEYSQETNLYRFLEINEKFKMHVYYLEELEHLRYWKPIAVDELDTVGRFHEHIKNGIYIPNAKKGWIEQSKEKDGKNFIVKVAEEEKVYRIHSKHGITLLFHGKHEEELEYALENLKKEISLPHVLNKIKTMVKSIDISASQIFTTRRRMFLNYLPFEVLKIIMEKELCGITKYRLEFLRKNMDDIEGELRLPKPEEGHKNPSKSFKYERWNEKKDVILEAGEYKGTLEHKIGIWKLYYPNGERYAEGKYKGRHPIGDWKWYYPNGKEALNSSYDEEGNEVGDWIYISKDGRLKLKITYQKLKKMKWEELSEARKKASRELHVSRNKHIFSNYVEIDKERNEKESTLTVEEVKDLLRNITNKKDGYNEGTDQETQGIIVNAIRRDLERKGMKVRTELLDENHIEIVGTDRDKEKFRIQIGARGEVLSEKYEEEGNAVHKVVINYEENDLIVYPQFSYLEEGKGILKDQDGWEVKKEVEEIEERVGIGRKITELKKKTVAMHLIRKIIRAGRVPRVTYREVEDKINGREVEEMYIEHLGGKKENYLLVLKDSEYSKGLGIQLGEMFILDILIGNVKGALLGNETDNVQVDEHATLNVKDATISARVMELIFKQTELSKGSIFLNLKEGITKLEKSKILKNMEIKIKRMIDDFKEKQEIPFIKSFIRSRLAGVLGEEMKKRLIIDISQGVMLGLESIYLNFNEEEIFFHKEDVEIDIIMEVLKKVQEIFNPKEEVNIGVKEMDLDKVLHYVYKKSQNASKELMLEARDVGSLQLVKKNTAQGSGIQAYEKYYEDSKKKSEDGFYKGGKRFGLQRRYGENGDMIYECNYNENGRKEGREKTWEMIEDRRVLMLEVNYKNGEYEGEVQEFFRDGTEKLYSMYKEGVLHGEYRMHKMYTKKTLYPEEIKEKIVDLLYRYGIKWEGYEIIGTRKDGFEKYSYKEGKINGDYEKTNRGVKRNNLHIEVLEKGQLDEKKERQGSFEFVEKQNKWTHHYVDGKRDGLYELRSDRGNVKGEYREDIRYGFWKHGEQESLYHRGGIIANIKRNNKGNEIIEIMLGGRKLTKIEEKEGYQKWEGERGQVEIRREKVEETIIVRRKNGEEEEKLVYQVDAKKDLKVEVEGTSLIGDQYKEEFKDLVEAIKGKRINPSIDVRVEVKTGDRKEAFGGTELKKVGVIEIEEYLDHSILISILKKMDQEELDKVIFIVGSQDFNSYKKRGKILKEALEPFGELFEVMGIEEEEKWGEKRGIEWLKGMNKNIDIKEYLIKGDGVVKLEDNGWWKETFDWNDAGITIEEEGRNEEERYKVLKDSRGNFIVLKVYKQMEDDQEGDLLRKYIASMFIKEACKEESKSPRYANVSIIRSSDFTDFSWKTPEEISEMMEVSHDAEILVMEYLSGESLKKGDVGKLSREVGSVAVLNLFTGPRDNSFKFQEEEVRVRKDSEVAYMGNILKMMRSVDVFAPEVAVRMRKYSEGLVWNKDVKRNSRTEEAIKKEIRETFSKVIIESTFAYREEKVDPMIEKTLGGLSFEVSEEEKGIVSKHYFEMLINMMLKYKRGGFNKFFAMAKGMRETYPKIQFEIEILEGYFEVLEEIYIKLSFYQEKLVGVKGIKTFKGDSINNRMAMTAQTYLFVGRYGEARSIVEKMFVSVKENGIERKHVEKEEVIDLFKEIDVRIKEVITASEEEVEPIEEERRKQIETNPLIQEPLKPEEEAGSIMGDKEMPEEAMKISIFMLEAPERHRVYYEMHGKNAVVGEYKNEKKEGLWCFYSSFGMIILKVRYKEGEIQEWWEYENSELREKKYLDVAVISDLVTKVLDRTIQDIEVQIGAMVQQ